MPSAEYTAAVKEAFASAPSNVVVLDTLEISHPDLGATLYLVKNRENLTLSLEDSSSHEFEGVGFRMSLPPAGENGIQDLSLAIDNTDRRITDLINVIKASKVPAEVKYRPYLSSDLLHPQTNVPLILYLRNVTLSVFEATGRASFADIINRKFPRENYTRDRFPSLGG
jgi:hypothetical protein